MKISILVYGGLGNQLFQIAFGQSLKLSYKNLDIDYINFTEFAKTKRVWELDYLKIKPVKISKIKLSSIFLKRKINSNLNKLWPKLNFLGIIDEYKYNLDSNFFDIKKKFIFDGYWQSERYFSKHGEDIKRFLNSPFKSIKNKNEKVAVHIRLGDYLSTPQGRSNHLVCDFDWYKKAISYLKDVNNNFKFTIFSDEIDFVKKEFQYLSNVDIYNSDYTKNAYEDLYKMASFDHFIISNSSYSWWASYLGEKENSKIIAPNYWFKNIKTKELPICRSNWIFI